MAEVALIVSGVLSLLPLCRDGIGILKEIFDSAKTLQIAVARIEFQQDRYKDWRETWRNDGGELDVKFETFANKDSISARKIYRQLVLMAQTMFDVRSMKEQFGIKPLHWPEREIKDFTKFKLRDGESHTLENQKLFLDRCKTNLSFIRKSKFVIRKTEPACNTFIDLLKQYEEGLGTLGYKFELERMRKGEYDRLRNMSLEQLQRRAEAAAYEAKHTPPGIELGDRYHNISLAAKFAIVVRYQREHGAYKFTMRDFRLDPTYILPSNVSSSMALLYDYPVKNEKRVVLIEWVEYSDRKAEKETMEKTLMLATPKPGQLLLPTCYGMVEDQAMRRYGLVLIPPAHIRANLPSVLPTGAISQKRTPVSLKELLDGKHPSCEETLDLGVRFRLAKKLVDAVHMMHCVGWIHKNIRSNSIIFFPAANATSSSHPEPDQSYPQRIGYDLPLFTGLFNPIIDDILEEAKEYGSSSSEANIYRSIDTRQLPGKGQNDITGILDYYQHPDKRLNPSIGYSRTHDIYSLGCVLLEIGLWEPLEQRVEVEDDNFERVKRGFQALAVKLDGLMGSIYADVVRRCLAINVRERTEIDARDLGKFCSDIAARLDKCCA